MEGHLMTCLSITGLAGVATHTHSQGRQEGQSGSSNCFPSWAWGCKVTGSPDQGPCLCVFAGTYAQRTGK